MLWCYDVRLGLRRLLVWRYAVLCPAFQWLLSKHTQRWKPFSPRTHIEWSFVLPDGSGDSKGPSPVVVPFVYCLHSNVARNIKHIKSADALTVCGSSYMMRWRAFFFWRSVKRRAKFTGNVVDPQWRIFRSAGVVLSCNQKSSNTINSTLLQWSTIDFLFVLSHLTLH